jgi:hypothetical protein
MIKHRTIIIPASVQPNARALCKGWQASQATACSHRTVCHGQGTGHALHQQRPDQP